MTNEMSKLKMAYMQLPKIEQVPFRERIIALCEVTKPTFYRWLDFPEQVPKISREIISNQFIQRDKSQKEFYKNLFL